MRVLMVSPTYYPIVGGAETVVRNISRELSKIGVHVEILTFNMDQCWNPRWSGRLEKLDGIAVHRIPALNWFPLTHSPRINLGINLIPGRFRYLTKEFDILHYHQAEFSFPLFSFSVRRPKILHLHGIRLANLQRYYLSRIMLTKAANLYLTLSNKMTEELTTLGVPEDKIMHLPNAVDTKTFCPKGNKLNNTLLYVGRITPDKGLHVLLRSLKHLKKPIRLEIIGAVNKKAHLTYYNYMRSLIEEQNSRGPHVVEYLGETKKETLLKWYQQTSVFVLPSLYEPFAVVLLEAMACETPVISTSVGGVPEIIENHKNGILIPPNDPLRLAEAINYLLENKAVRIAMGKAARDKVKETFALEVIAKRLCTIYEKISLNS